MIVDRVSARRSGMKTGLVVIDMLNDFQDGALANPAAEDIVGPLKKLIKAARANKRLGRHLR